jgi:thiamine-phosphate pyrophosphorylase
MFVFKKKYFLIIENTKDFNLRNIKKYNKFVIIYRRSSKPEPLHNLVKFRKQCRLKLIKFFVANDMRLSAELNSDGLYLSSYNKSFFKSYSYTNKNFSIIGSAHNMYEISQKIKQGCSFILMSKLFQVDYDKKSPYLNIIKFNYFLFNNLKRLIPLGGIKITNLNKLKSINCEGIALLSEIKKKPANIINRLF